MTMLPVHVRRKAGEWSRANKDAPLVTAFLAGYQYAVESPASAQHQPFSPCPGSARSAPETEVTTDTFLTVWNLYDRKDAKQNAIKAWRKLTPHEQTLALQHIPFFVRAHPDKKYRPMLATYLNQKRFLDDEIINTADNDNTQSSRLSAYADTIANYR